MKNYLRLFPLVLYFFVALIFAVYSYGFVDFNLTLSSHPTVVGFVAWVQSLTYYARDLSTLVFVALIIAFFISYLLVLKYYSAPKFPWKFILLIGLIFTFAYPLLSYDVFKYLFGAKTVFLYHANPHLISPQVFEGDTWLRFMRWVHTQSPYGPIFTLLTFPAYLLALGKFVPALYLYKLCNLAWYLLAVWAVGKLGNAKAQLFFAFNPLVLIEWLVNAHNDAPMIAMLLFSLFLLNTRRPLASTLTLLFSIGVKFITLVLTPVIFLRQKLSDNQIYYYLIFTLGLAPVMYNYETQYQAWYVTWLIPFAGLLPHKSIKWIIGVYSLAVFTRYLSFINTGLWETTIRDNTLMTFGPVILTLIVCLLYSLASKKMLSNAD